MKARSKLHEKSFGSKGGTEERRSPANEEEKTDAGFSIPELEALGETAFFHTKRRITEKIFAGLAGAAEAIKATSAFSSIAFPEGTDVQRGKISKGENYLGLPFILLDFPRLFTREQLFAFRTMIWWGHHMSCTFIVSGHGLEAARRQLLAHHTTLSSHGTLICIHQSPWHHHLGEENFLPLKKLSRSRLKQLFTQQHFLKVALHAPVTAAATLPQFASQSFERLACLM